MYSQSRITNNKYLLVFQIFCDFPAFPPKTTIIFGFWATFQVIWRRKKIQNYPEVWRSPVYIFTSKSKWPFPNPCSYTVTQRLNHNDIERLRRKQLTVIALWNGFMGMLLQSQSNIETQLCSWSWKTICGLLVLFYMEAYNMFMYQQTL